MSIFKDKTEHDYRADMNILFFAHNEVYEDELVKYCMDFAALGVAYLQNAEITLTYLLESCRYNNDAHTMVFPVLFTIWHGLELLLKSGNMLCDKMLGETGKKYTKHTIDVYSDIFREKLKRLGFETVEQDYLSGMIQFIDDCKEKDAHFDFARYTNQSNGSQQFYNKLDEDGVFPKVSVDMIELAKVLTLINYGVTNVVDYLLDMYTKHGAESKDKISDFGLKLYVEHSSFARFVGMDGTLELKDIVEKIKAELNEKRFQEKPKQKE